MLSPSVCRLTLARLVFCWGRSSPIFPCTSVETGDKSVASLERSSKSPSALFLALPENGHSPDIFSSFSFAQNILAAANVQVLIWFQRSAVPVERLRSLTEMPSSGVLMHTMRSPPLPTRRSKWSAPKKKPESACNIHKELHGHKMVGNYHLPKANEKLEKKRENGRPNHTRVGLVSLSDLSARRNYFQAGDSSHAMHFSYLDQPLDWITHETGRCLRMVMSLRR